MDQKIIQSGYVIQLYQYARRYRYNNEGFLADCTWVQPEDSNPRELGVENLLL